MLRLRKYGNAGPDVPQAWQGKTFRSYVDMADYADKVGLPDGDYFIRNSNGTTFATAVCKLTRKGGSFYVEGRGNV
jgi:hypothetical protein